MHFKSHFLWYSSVVLSSALSSCSALSACPFPFNRVFYIVFTVLHVVRSVGCDCSICCHWSCKSGQWMSGEQECDKRSLLGVFLSLSQLQEGPRCAATCPCTSVCSPSSSQWHPRLRSSPLTPRLSCTWLAWKKCRPSLSPLFSLALWCLKCDCSWIVAAFPWRFWHEKQVGLSGLSHGQWSRTKTINLLAVGYYYR